MARDGWDRQPEDASDLAEVDDGVFRVLRDAHRRFVLYYLLEHRTAAVEELADVVTGWSHAPTTGVANPADRDRIRVALWHTHLPMMREAGLVTFDEEAGVVSLTVDSAAVQAVIQWSYVRERSGGGT